MKIVADKHIPYVKEFFTNYGELILVNGRTITRADIKDADILLVRSITAVNQKLLDNTKVRFVGSITTGADHLDTKWLNKVDIAWANVRGFNAPPVADYVVSVIAALQTKKLLQGERKKAAIIGVGSIGDLVCKRLKLFNFDVILCDPVRAKKEKKFRSVPIEEIADVDFITLHVPLIRNSPHSTYHFIDKDFLDRQKENCILLNTCRGSVIDAAALLRYGTHLGWCFDVWENEPDINQAILQKAIIATPHIAGYSVQSRIRGITELYQLMLRKKIITEKLAQPISMPTQQLLFTNKKYTWQEVVLGSFNPLLMTDMLRSAFCTSATAAMAFDKLRNQFHDRYEFAYTEIEANVSRDDTALLKKLGFKFK